MQVLLYGEELSVKLIVFPPIGGIVGVGLLMHLQDLQKHSIL